MDYYWQQMNKKKKIQEILKKTKEHDYNAGFSTAYPFKNFNNIYLRFPINNNKYSELTSIIQTQRNYKHSENNQNDEFSISRTKQWRTRKLNKKNKQSGGELKINQQIKDIDEKNLKFLKLKKCKQRSRSVLERIQGWESNNNQQLYFQDQIFENQSNCYFLR